MKVSFLALQTGQTSGASPSMVIPQIGHTQISLDSKSADFSAASKAAVYSMTKTLGAELAPFNIRVVCFAPGMIKTRMTEKLIEAKSEELQRQASLQRIGEPEEVAKVVLFLASNLAAYITGCCVEISGGKFCVQNPQDAWL